MQTRYHNYRRSLVSFDENLRIIGAITPGRYSGFDTGELVSGTTFDVSHAATGIAPTNIDGSTPSKRGVAVTPQGVFVYEDGAITVTVDTNVGNASARRDILVMGHSFIASDGGAAALYSVIKGATGSDTEPLLSNPATQVKLGTFYIEALASNHSNTIYVPDAPRSLGGILPLALDRNGEVNQSNIGASRGDLNRLIRSSLNYFESPSNAPSTSSSNWFVTVLNKGTSVHQLGLALNTGKSYSRSSSDAGATWTPWESLNNSDVNTDLVALAAKVGPLLYSLNNLLTDSETITASLEKLDLYVGTNNAAISTLGTRTTNLESSRVLKTGDTMSGPLTIPAGTLGGHAVNKTQLDAKADSANPTWTTVVSFNAPWVQQNFTVRYTKDSLGRVHLMGELWSNGSNVAVGDITIFTLPVGFRPSQEVEFAAVYFSGGARPVCYIRVTPTGNVLFLILAALHPLPVSNLRLDTVSFFTN